MNTFDEIIQTKAYNDLSSAELEVIRELVSSEEEYNEMKSFYAGIDHLAISTREEVSPSVKSSLNSVFQAKHPGISQNWNATAEVQEKKIIPLYNTTWFRVAAILVLSAGVITVWVSMSENQLAKSEKVQMTASTDSVPREKQKVEPKKKFPLNAGNEKQFTAASTIPKDENLEQQMPITSNATSSANSSTGIYQWASSDKSLSPSSGGTYKVSAPADRATYFSTNRAEKGMKKLEDEKETLSVVNGLSKAGLDADLNPGRVYGESTKDYKPGISTTDMLSLIEPSF
nr:hypothetical protein [uncultured Fluviicola sp.]